MISQIGPGHDNMAGDVRFEFHVFKYVVSVVLQIEPNS